MPPYVAPTVQRWHRAAATGLGATMWFWLFYRFKQDGRTLLGLEYPWEAHGHGGHGAGHETGHERRH
jgi:hypothetical protein